jgi:hypothetical protein
MLAASRYEAEYNVSPADLLHPDLMSDYASGPPSETGETQDQWKRRMADKSGCVVDEMTEEDFDARTFWEHIKPQWRSEEVGTFSLNCGLLAYVLVAHRSVSEASRLLVGVSSAA